MGTSATESTAIGGLFESFRIKNLNLSNRFVMAPMTRRGAVNGIPGIDVAEYYRKRAAGGVGLLITEGIYIDHPTAGVDTTVPLLSTPESIRAWKVVTDAVHFEGSKIIAQLWHVGIAKSLRPSTLHPEANVASPSGVDNLGRLVGPALTIAEISEIVVAYAEAAKNAVSAGFDGVEIHGAHGYLIDSFLWRDTNFRSDKYGGGLKERARLAVEVVQAIRAEVGPDITIIYRLSQFKEQFWTARVCNSPAELETLLEILRDGGVDIFDVSTRRFWLPAFVELSGLDGSRTLSGWVKKLSGIPTIAVGSVGLEQMYDSHAIQRATPANLEQLIERFDEGDYDLIALGRVLISDPNWVEKLRRGQTSDWLQYTPDALKSLN